MKKYYLLNWKFNFADEFDMSGFLVVDEAHYNEYLKNLDTFKNEPKFDLVNKNVKDPYFDGLSICFGTNESKMYDSREELLEDISSKEDNLTGLSSVLFLITSYNQLKDKEEYTILSSMLLRSMQKAVYDKNNIGHFGLASKCYTHFTSPIRRYPDLLIHRIIMTFIC